MLMADKTINPAHTIQVLKIIRLRPVKKVFTACIDL